LTQKFSLIVRVERPQKTFGEAMNEIRSWLDSHKIQPAVFNSDINTAGAVTFEIKFARDDEARLFEQAFNSPSPNLGAL
jgi:hypothetical protein